MCVRHLQKYFVNSRYGQEMTELLLSSSSCQYNPHYHIEWYVVEGVVIQALKAQALKPGY